MGKEWTKGTFYNVRKYEKQCIYPALHFFFRAEVPKL